MSLYKCFNIVNTKKLLIWTRQKLKHVDTFSLNLFPNDRGLLQKAVNKKSDIDIDDISLKQGSFTLGEKNLFLFWNTSTAFSPLTL